jgi:two-component system response regulator DegU
MDELTTKFTDGTLNIWLVDDHEMIHQSIRETISSAQWRVNLQSFYCCEDALRTLQESTAPDVILQDISIPNKMGGIDALEIYKHTVPQTKVIIFTVHEDDVYVLESIRRGANGYFAKSSSNERLLHAIQDVLDGLMPIDPHVAGKVLSYFSMFSEMKSEVNLTQREIEVLHLLASKKTRAEIAYDLFSTEGTIKNHIGNIYSKLQVHTRTEAVLLAMKKRLI